MDMIGPDSDLEDHELPESDSVFSFCEIRPRRSYTVQRKMQVLEDLRVKYDNNRSRCGKRIFLDRH